MQKKNPTLLIGAHMSIAGGFDQAIIRGESIGCTAIQIFTKSNRQWHSPKITPDAAATFQAAQHRSTVQSVVAHAAYLINIGATDPQIHTKSVTALIDELERCALLGIPYLVMHPGSYGTAEADASLEQIARSLDHVIEANPHNHCMILLETMAGQGTSVGNSFEQLAHIRKLTKHKSRIGFCADTCHMFVAGYDLRNQHEYTKTWDAFDATIGLAHLKVIHVNDSKKGLKSRLDRHENIGKGALGLTAFELLFNDPRFFDIPKILETPKASLEDDAINLQTLKGLLSTETKKLLKR